MTDRRRALLACALLLLALPLLACGGLSAATGGPRWACPSPTPLPYGPDGPMKEVIRHTRPISAGGDWEEPVFYTIWEQEYGDLGGPPFPPPTPYALVGTSYVFGQRVEIWPFHLLVDAAAGPLVDEPGVAPGSQQLYLITLTWNNHTESDAPVSYAARVRLRAITEKSGAVVSDSRWGMSARSLALAGIASLPESIPPGESRVTVPVLAPPGEPEVVEVTFDATPPAAPGATPTPTRNDDLRAVAQEALSVTWSNATWRTPGAPPCGDPGVLTDWSGGGAWGRPAQLGVPAPPGSDRLIQLVLAQVGKRYRWGAKGPEVFDCSGLASWSYAQIGIAIPQGTAGQWPGLRAVTAGELRAGDLVFFDIAGRGRIDHVGVLVGDIDGDGRWDMVHAASPALGVRLESGVFESASYAPRIRGFRTAR